MIFQDSREMSSAYKTLKEEIGNKAKIETDISRTTDQLMKVEDQNAFLDFCFLIDSQYFPLDLSPSLPLRFLSFGSSRLTVCIIIILFLCFPQRRRPGDLPQRAAGRGRRRGRKVKKTCDVFFRLHCCAASLILDEDKGIGDDGDELSNLFLANLDGLDGDCAKTTSMRWDEMR